MSFTLRSFAVATALTLSFPLALLVSTPSGAATSTIPECPPVAKTATGNQSSAINATNSGGTWNLDGAVWSNVPDPIVFPIQSESWTRGCIVGGTVDGNTPRDWTRDMWYNGEDGGNAKYDDAEGVRLKLTDTANNFAVVRDVFVSDVEDAFDPDGGSITNATYLDHVHAEYIRDDCIENEKSVHNMYISNSLFDGCFVAFAEKPDDSSADAGTADADFVVEDSLVYVQPQPLGPNYCSSSKVSQDRCKATDKSNVWLGSYGMFKWGKSAAANVVIRDTIFRVDMPSYSSCSGNRFPTNGTYENVTLVYTGPGSWTTAGDCSNVVPKGVTVTTDKSVWDKAKAAWLDGSSTAPPAEEPPAEEPPAEEPPAEEPSDSDAAIADALARLEQAQSALDRAAVEVAAIERLLQDMQSSA